MRTKQLLSSFLVVTAQIFSHGAASGSSHGSRGYTSNTSTVVGGSDLGASISGSDSSSSSVTFPESTLVVGSSVTEQPSITARTPTQTPTPAPPASNSSTAAPIVIEYDDSSSSQLESSAATESSSSSSFRSDESIVATTDTAQSAPVTSAPIFLRAISGSSSDSTTGNNGASASTDTSDSDTESEASFAKPSSDSSTFQTVESQECSATEVDNVYTLYSNCRSAFDLCVSASDYQIFPYQGDQPTQAQIQDMAESDACTAVFVIVIEANFSACTIGGMPLVSAVETLLKISVDLQEGLENEAPSAGVFQELLAWRYQVDLAKAANVPYDGSSQFYAEFEANLDAALKNTSIRVNEDRTVDVRLANGSYDTFEDAIDLVVTDASAADLMPGYVVASSQADASTSSNAIAIESSRATYCTPNLGSVVVVVVVAAFILVEGRIV